MGGPTLQSLPKMPKPQSWYWPNKEHAWIPYDTDRRKPKKGRCVQREVETTEEVENTENVDSVRICDEREKRRADFFAAKAHIKEIKASKAFCKGRTTQRVRRT